MKRTVEFVSDNTRTKRPKLYNLDIQEKYISATHLYNYLIGDPIVDWFKKYTKINYNSNNNCSNNFISCIMQKGIDFEEYIINCLKEKHDVVSISNVINEETIQKTKDCMMEGAPIIHSAPLKNELKKLQGIADLLIRSDYISCLFDIEPLEDNEINIFSPKLNNNYYYVVVDIKFSTLPLRSDRIHILNSPKYIAYKSQCLVYTEAVGNIQGYTSNLSFIMGRRNKNVKNGIVNNCRNCFDRLGRIDYNGLDIDILSKMNKAIKWIKDVKKYGKKWKINPPSRKELYPNMCVDSGIWNNKKEEIANDIGEITKIWYVGTKNRNIALEKGIKSWRDKKCNSKNLNIKGTRGKVIDSILNINRQKEIKVLPKVINNNLYDWKHKLNEVFVDFETISDITSDFNNDIFGKSKDIIFMIGVGYEDNGKFQYRKFICDNNSRESEFKMMNDFKTIMYERNFPKMYCWYAEENFWKTAEQRQFDIACENNDDERKDLISDKWKNHNWADLCKVFQSEPIVIKDCFKFGLKLYIKIN